MQRRRRKSRKKPKIVGIIIVLFIIVGLIFATIKISPFFRSNAATVQRKTSTSKKVIPKSTIPKDKTISLAQIQNTHTLDLVNATYAVSVEPTAAELVPVSPTIPALSPTITLKKATLDAVSQLITATKNAVGGTIDVSSGFRNLAEQTQLYDSATDKSYVQTPGHSEHETGLAVDIAVENVKDVEDSPQSQYLRANAWKYGLILRYPADKVQITGISNEAWHFRYIGKIHAWYCNQHNLAYEEYIQFLKNSGGYTQILDGVSYTVSYQIAKNNELIVPNLEQYEVSSDNTGGYIITSWKAV